jgi:hypothetical protein
MRGSSGFSRIAVGGPESGPRELGDP